MLSPGIVTIAQGYAVHVTHHESFDTGLSRFTFICGSLHYVITEKELFPLYKAGDYVGMERLVHRACQIVTDEMGSLYALSDEARVATPGKQA